MARNPKLAEEKLLPPKRRPIAGGLPSLPPRVPSNYAKLWPNMAPAMSEELFCVQRRASQEKALSFGVFDWRRLERSNKDRSRHLSYDFSSVSAFGSSTEVSSSRKIQFSPLDCRRSSSAAVASRRSVDSTQIKRADRRILPDLFDSKRFGLGLSSSCELSASLSFPLDNPQTSVTKNREFSFGSSCELSQDVSRSCPLGDRRISAREFSFGSSCELSPGISRSCTLSNPQILATKNRECRLTSPSSSCELFPGFSRSCPLDNPQISAVKNRECRLASPSLSCELSSGFSRSCPLGNPQTSAKKNREFSPSLVKTGRCSSVSRVSPSGESDPGRRRSGSPFRRFLDPILRSSRSSVSSSPARMLVFSPRSSNASNGGGVDQVNGHRQALLRESWKDGIPLFTLSAVNGDVLAATRKEEEEKLFYTFYCVQRGRKKAAGGWMAPGRRRELVPNIIGRMTISIDRTAEFVLTGPDLIPTVRSDGYQSAELAAVVLGEEVVAILPREIHGRAAAGGKPATLIHRWRYDGRCDCGGWDAGCPLAVLRTHSPEKDVGTHGQVKLFPPGGGGKGAMFSMVGSGEGVYAVEFHVSITDLQALAVCVAVLHGRRRGDSIGSKQCGPPLSPVCRA